MTGAVPPPSLSVILPVYNGGRYLGLALSSVLAQAGVDFEVIALDDGSTDGSLALLRSIAERDPRLRVVHRENRGLVATLNELLELARHALVVRMDADDVCLPGRFAAQAAFLRGHPEVVCVGGGMELIDDKGRYLVTLHLPTDNAVIQREALHGRTTICHPCAVYRKDAVLRVGAYRHDFYPAEDLDLWLRLGEIGELANLDRPVLQYRQHTTSISGQAASVQGAAAERGCRAAWARRGITDGVFHAGEPWRPTASRASRHAFYLRYGWWAYASGQRRTSLFYAGKAVAQMPGALAGWKLLAKSLGRSLPVPAQRGSLDGGH